MKIEHVLILLKGLLIVSLGNNFFTQTVSLNQTGNASKMDDDFLQGIDVKDQLQLSFPGRNLVSPQLFNQPVIVPCCKNRSFWNYDWKKDEFHYTRLATGNCKYFIDCRLCGKCHCELSEAQSFFFAGDCKSSFFFILLTDREMIRNLVRLQLSMITMESFLLFLHDHLKNAPRVEPHLSCKAHESKEEKGLKADNLCGKYWCPKCVLRRDVIQFMSVDVETD